MMPIPEQSVINALQRERVDRYLPAATSDGVSALDLYLWDLSIAESFHWPLHYAEITVRNALHDALCAQNAVWYNDAGFRRLLSDHHRNNLSHAIQQEQRQHGTRFTHHHLVATLTLGFWNHLATSRFRNYLWQVDLRTYFPNAPVGSTRQDLWKLIETTRLWRNRVFHHQTLFNKTPQRKHEDVIKLIRWRCDDTADWVRSRSRVPQVINQRPSA